LDGESLTFVPPDAQMDKLETMLSHIQLGVPAARSSAVIHENCSSGSVWLQILQYVLDIANAELSVQQQIYDPQPVRIP